MIVSVFVTGDSTGRCGRLPAWEWHGFTVCDSGKCTSGCVHKASRYHGVISWRLLTIKTCPYTVGCPVLADTAKMVDSSTQMPAVLAVPSTYNNDQKYSIKYDIRFMVFAEMMKICCYLLLVCRQCAQKAGFKVLSVLSQPSLSILPYSECCSNAF